MVRSVVSSTNKRSRCSKPKKPKFDFQRSKHELSVIKSKAYNVVAAAIEYGFANNLIERRGDLFKLKEAPAKDSLGRIVEVKKTPSDNPSMNEPTSFRNQNINEGSKQEFKDIEDTKTIFADARRHGDKKRISRTRSSHSSKRSVSSSTSNGTCRCVRCKCKKKKQKHKEN